MTDTDTVDDTLRPFDLQNFHGQPKLKERLQVHIVSALTSGRPLPHILLAGPAGAGKSTLAHLIADEMLESMAVVPVASKPRQIHYSLMELDHGGIVFFDELQSYTKATQETLLPLLGEGNYQGTSLIDWHYPHLTVIAATTEPQKICKPLKDRFPIQPPFAPYTAEEMAQIVFMFAERMDVMMDDETMMALGQASAGTPRVARSFVIAARDLAAYGREPTAERVLAFCDVASDGLNADHLAYLAALLKNRGQAGIEVLVNRLRIDKQEVLRLEQLLIDRDYLETNSQGRVLTPAGRDRLREATA